MNTYVALLRGINVGGNAKVEMPKLKKLFESLKLKDVRTYINSGNVIFRDDRTPQVLNQLIETSLRAEFGFDIKVILKDLKEIDNIAKNVPKTWTNDLTQKTDVMFLREDIDSPDIMTKVKINPDIENVIYAKGAIVWNIGRENISKGNGIKLIKTDLYKKMTVRNINTVRKIQQLMVL